MFILYGNRTALIKTEVDNHEVCGTCNGVGIDITVYRKYFHIFFLPMFPSESKDAFMHCSHCGERKWIKGKRELYEKATRTPFYFYTGIAICAVFAVCFLIATINAGNNANRYINNPRVGDVYTVMRENDSTTAYYFLKVKQVTDDSVYTFRSRYMYNGIADQFDKLDYFVASTNLGFSKKDLQALYDKETIVHIYRSYGSNTGFDRVKE